MVNKSIGDRDDGKAPEQLAKISFKVTALE